MTDALYILGTVAFFGLAIAYVRWCESLGRKSAQGEGEAKP